MGHKDPGLETAGVFGGAQQGDSVFENMRQEGRRYGGQGKPPASSAPTAAEVMAID